ncbi:MAG: T9SS type A sorting domain-containing protein [Sphingobacteriales bacterium]|nr:MAG: T9SS type A sorting domain-containing protein [Sphingobacteriales bacterium]
MIQSLKKLAAALCLLVAAAIPVTAQVFTSPTAYAFPYGDPVVGIDPNVTANYSKRNLNTSFGLTDMYLSAWSTNDPGGGSPSEVIYMFSAPAAPTVMLSQGSIKYQGVADLGVGMIFDGNTGNYLALVTYYDYLGLNSASGQPGHILDQYTINGPIGSPLIFSSKIQLSYTRDYGRIRMDSHIEYAAAIVWQNPGVGIETIVANNGSWSGITTLAGTEPETGPDVAFSHTSNLDVNFVYQSPSSGTITKSSLDWPTLLAVPFGGTAVMLPNIQDVDAGIPFPISELVLDCPDHYDVDNWAYTYTDGLNVYVRHIDFHSSGTPMTTIVNDGSLGNAPLTNYQIAFNPTLHYGDRAIGGGSGEIMVGWNSSYGPTSHAESRYVAIEMFENGSGLHSLHDYMELPNGQLGGHFNAAISFSKMSDLQYPGAPDFLYATYITQRNFSSGFASFELQHAFHKWMNPVFKGVRPPMLHPECSSPGLKAQPELVRSTASPNPFRQSLINSVNLKEDARVELVLIDMAGRIVARKATQLNKGNHQVVMNGLGPLTAGTYVLNTTINGKKTAAQLLLKQ